MDMGKILRAAVSLEYQKWMECRYHGIDPMRLGDIQPPARNREAVALFAGLGFPERGSGLLIGAPDLPEHFGAVGFCAGPGLD